MKIISVREHPEYRDRAILYFQNCWPEVSPILYDDCIQHCVKARNALPQWYLLEKENEIIGCAGLITNDFNSRMDLYPWICALYVEENHRKNAYGSLLMAKAKEDTQKAGFRHLYLCTDHIGYYEKYGFDYIGQCYHPWGGESRIYELEIKENKESFI